MRSQPGSRSDLKASIKVSITKLDAQSEETTMLTTDRGSLLVHQWLTANGAYRIRRKEKFLVREFPRDSKRELHPQEKKSTIHDKNQATLARYATKYLGISRSSPHKMAPSHISIQNCTDQRRRQLGRPKTRNRSCTNLLASFATLSTTAPL